MSDFSALLRQIESTLDVPQPAKSRILIEVAADMDELYTRCRRAGAGEAEAHAQVEERFRLGREALGELAELHRGPLARSLRRLPPWANYLPEAGVVATALLLVAVFAPVVLDAAFLRAAGPVTPLVGIVFAACLIAAVPVGSRLWLRQEHDLDELRRGLDAVASGAVISISLAAAIVVRAGARATLPLVEGAAARDYLEVARQHTAASAMAMLGVVACALVWFVLRRKVARIGHAAQTWIEEVRAEPRAPQHRATQLEEAT